MRDKAIGITALLELREYIERYLDVCHCKPTLTHKWLRTNGYSIEESMLLVLALGGRCDCMVAMNFPDTEREAREKLRLVLREVDVLTTEERTLIEKTLAARPRRQPRSWMGTSERVQ